MSLPTFPGYRAVSPVGSGGFAEVYRAQREGPLGRWVAIKLFKVTLADAEAARQFRDECSAIMRLDGQPDVLTVHDAAVHDDGRPYLVMELCDSSLLGLLQRRPLPVGEVVVIGERIATALDAAHFARVLHGDVTPQNILFRTSGGPVLADFGLAVLRDHRGNTAAGFNPAHAAPETLRHDGAIDERTDVYGLGSTLHTALTGAPPFPPRMGENDAARALRVTREPAPRAAGAPAWLADLLESMLAKDPAARPSAAAVAAALSQGGFAPAGATSGVPPVLPPTFGPPPGFPPAPPVPAGSGFGPPPTGGPPVPAGPSYGAPPGGESSRGRSTADSQDYTHRRAAGHPIPDHDSDAAGEDTRLRAGRPAAATPAAPPASSAHWRRPLVLIVAGLVVVAGAGGAAAALGLFGGGGDQAPPAASAPTDTPIDLAEPVDDGSSVTLNWTAAGTLDYGVVVAAEGAAPTVSLADRRTTLTVPVEPGTRYCFQVQGTDGRGGVAESNVVSVRGAVCRF